MDRTFVIIKPGALKRDVADDICDYMEEHHFKFVEGQNVTLLSREKLERHYAHLKDHPRFEKIIENMQSGPAFFFIVTNAPGAPADPPLWPRLRALLGATDPRKAAPDTIRCKFGIDLDDNVIHASESREEAEAEIALWMTK